MVRKQMTDEEKVAKKLSEIVSDVRLDLDMVGVYLFQLAPNVSYRRLSEIVEVVEYQKERARIDRDTDTLF